MIIQKDSFIMPTPLITGVEVELMNDLVPHYSREFPVEYLQEKMVYILAIEIVIAGAPGALNSWIELSPFPTNNNAMWPAPLPAAGVYWGAIGGGGGAMPPVAPIIEAATAVDGTMHTIILPWAIHSAWARLVVQVPVAAAPATAFWAIQAIVAGKEG